MTLKHEPVNADVIDVACRTAESHCFRGANLSRIYATLDNIVRFQARRAVLQSAQDIDTGYDQPCIRRDVKRVEYGFTSAVYRPYPIRRVNARKNEVTLGVEWQRKH